jgi:hypothetical protein
MSDAHVHNLFASALTSVLRANEERRRVYVEAAIERQVKQGVVQGLVNVDGVGESVVVVSFPVVFMEKPVFAPGLELADNYWLALGQFPLWAAVVAMWITDTSASGVVRYIGAEIGVNITGPDTLRSIFHYSFSGKSFSNPANRDPSVGGTL